MKKLLVVLLIIGIVLIILVLGIGIYFYNYHVFKTVRICIGEGRSIVIPCQETLDCVDLIRKDIGKGFSDAPEFIQKNSWEIINEIIYCEGNCFMKNVRGVNLETGEFEMLNSCRTGEKEILIEIRGREGLEILKYLEN